VALGDRDLRRVEPGKHAKQEGSRRGRRLQRALEGQAVVDVSFAISGRRDGTFDRGILLWSSALQYVAWVGGTAAGVMLAGLDLDPDAWGLDVVMPAFFMSMLVAELRTQRMAGVLAAGIAVVLAAAGTFVLDPGAPVAVAALACLVGLSGIRAKR